MEKNNKDDKFIYFSFSVYAYLFSSKPDCILEFKIECDETGKPFKLYRGQWDKNLSVETNTILISTHEALDDAIRSILLELREMEFKSNLYKGLTVTPKVEYYIPLIAKLENNILEGDTTSKTIFGNRLKYSDQKEVEDVLATHGYRTLQDGSNRINVDEHKAILFEKFVTEEMKV